jgi:hypothetical protein
MAVRPALIRIKSPLHVQSSGPPRWFTSACLAARPRGNTAYNPPVVAHIEFLPKFGDPSQVIMWPHVNVNTLVKQ